MPARSFGRKSAPFFLAAALALVPVMAGAQNLLANPEFTTDRASWSDNGFGNITPEAGSGSPAAGSLRVANDDAPMTILVHQCVSVTAGTSVEFGGRIFTIAAIAPESHGIYARFFDGLSCGGSEVIRNSAIQGADVGGGWFQWAASNQEVPATAVSARVELEVMVNVDGTGDVQFDHIYFGLAGTTPVELQSFGAE